MPEPQLLKPYCKSVLQVELPVTVTLASKRMKVEQLLRLVPGMMIQFDKPFDAPMTVEAAGQPIAEGDVVKAGDKFGIRVATINSPAERFVSLTKGTVGPE
jgi:flagellar motor switch protein FliN